MVATNMLDEAIGIFHQRAQTLGVATRAGGTSMTAGVPGEQMKIVQTQPVDNILQPARMLVAAVK